jgi:hypothetical protein
LLTFLLNSHPKIATIGELKGTPIDVRTYRCSCGELIGHCAFWARLLRDLHDRGARFELADMWWQSGFRFPGAPLANRIVSHRHRSWPFELCRDAFLRLSPACRRIFARILWTNEVFVQAVTELTGRPIFLDAPKDAIRLKYLRRVDAFNTKVIYLVRDGRGVMLSNMKHVGMSPQLAAREWVSAQREISCALRAFAPDSQLLIRYEDLCRDPRAVMDRVFRFISVAPEEAAHDFRAFEHHILGNAMRLDNRSEIRLDVRWQTELSPADLATFRRIGGRWNRKLGYDVDPPAGPGIAAHHPVVLDETRPDA